MVKAIKSTVREGSLVLFEFDPGPLEERTYERGIVCEVDYAHVRIWWDLSPANSYRWRELEKWVVRGQMKVEVW